MIAFFLLLAAAPDVRFVTKVEPRSWQPIEPTDTERLIEQHTLTELGKKGLLRLEKSKLSEMAESDYSLLIEGRFIEDAGKFSVYLTFSPQKKSDAPSLYVIDTDEVENKSVAEMQKIIIALVSRAARRLSATLEPHLTGTSADILEPQELPLSWGELDIPRLKDAKGAVATLINVRSEDHERAKAMAELKGHAFDQPPARMALELCVLYDPSAKLRADCVEALAPVARTRAETQRLLLYAMRNDVEGNVVKEIAEASKGFVGISRKEALATWMEVVADDGSPAEAASPVSQLLREENNIPNLELAVTKCLLGTSLAYGKHTACSDNLLKKLPPERQRAVALRYLQQAKVFNQGAMNAFEDIIDVLTPKNYKDRLDPQTAAFVSELLTSPRMGIGMHKLIYLLRKHPSPDGATVDRLLYVAKTRHHASSAFQTIGELARDNPSFKSIALPRLKKFDSGQTYMAAAGHGDPKKDLQKLITQLEK